jgi:hypothetical protein
LKIWKIVLRKTALNLSALIMGTLSLTLCVFDFLFIELPTNDLRGIIYDIIWFIIVGFFTGLNIWSICNQYKQEKKYNA